MRDNRGDWRLNNTMDRGDWRRQTPTETEQTTIPKFGKIINLRYGQPGAINIKVAGCPIK
jgi:hypothetical protein